MWRSGWVGNDSCSLHRVQPQNNEADPTGIMWKPVLELQSLVMDDHWLCWLISKIAFVVEWCPAHGQFTSRGSWGDWFFNMCDLEQVSWFSEPQCLHLQNGDIMEYKFITWDFQYLLRMMMITWTLFNNRMLAWSLLIPSTSLGNRCYYYLCFTNEETKA